MNRINFKKENNNFNKGFFNQINYMKTPVIINNDLKTETSDFKDTKILFNKSIVKNEKKVLNEVEVRVIDNDNRKYNEYGIYIYHNHNEYSIINKYGTKTSIKISDNIAGCGVQQLYGWSNSCNNIELDILIKYIIKNVHYGTGLIMCQLGKDYFDSYIIEALENNDFKYFEEYVNPYHDMTYKGRIYTLNLYNKK